MLKAFGISKIWSYGSMWFVKIPRWKWCTLLFILKQQILRQWIGSCCNWSLRNSVIFFLGFNGRWLQKISRHLGLIRSSNNGWIIVALRLQIGKSYGFVDGSRRIIRRSLIVSIVTGVIFMSINSIWMLKSLEVYGNVLLCSTTIPKGGVIKASIVKAKWIELKATCLYGVSRDLTIRYQVLNMLLRLSESVHFYSINKI